MWEITGICSKTITLCFINIDDKQTKTLICVKAEITTSGFVFNKNFLNLKKEKKTLFVFKFFIFTLGLIKKV